MLTGIPLVDAMIGIITASIYAIIFAFSFIIGFLHTASDGQLMGLY